MYVNRYYLNIYVLRDTVYAYNKTLFILDWLTLWQPDTTMHAVCFPRDSLKRLVTGTIKSKIYYCENYQSKHSSIILNGNKGWTHDEQRHAKNTSELHFYLTLM